MVTRLEDRLWLGYEGTTRDLSQVVTDPTTDEIDRLSAGLALGRWYMANGEFELALVNLEVAHRALDVVDAEGASLEAEVVSLEADCLCQLGRYADALRLLSPLPSDVNRDLRVGAARAGAMRDEPHGSGPVVEALNALYGAAGYAQVFRRDVTEPIGLHTITSAPPRRVERPSDGMVSVIVPACNVTDTLHTALTGLLEQTWRHLEIIVVDDCSTDDTADVVKRLARSDDRLRLVRNRMKLGAYASRNVGLEHARGDFITVHDANDWSHPQKVEVQAARLAGSPSLVATGTHCVRTTEDLVPTTFDGRPGHRLIGQNASSLMCRRQVFDIVGTWDDVRVAADDEFQQRVQAHYGTAAIHWIDPEVPLSILVSAGTSSGATGFMSRFHALGALRLYRDAYQWWHASDSFTDGLPFVPTRSTRPFPVPTVLEPGQRGANVQLDVVYANDLGNNDLFAGHVLAELTRRDPTTVGLLHLPSFAGSSQRACEDFRAIVSAGATMIGKDEVVDCDLLVVGPAIGQSPQLVGLPAIHARRAVIVGGQPDDEGISLMEAVGAVSEEVRHCELTGLEDPALCN